METVLITGATRGIGLEMARHHVERGDRVIAVCRKASDALRNTGAEIIDKVDMADGVTIDSLSTFFEMHSIDRLIANAGLRGLEGYDDIDYDAIRYQFEVNALGPLRLVRTLDDALRDGAKVILISTRVASLKDNTGGGEFGYRMSKAALNMAGVNLAIALKPREIAVLMLHPGFVRTALTGGEGLIDAHQSADALVSISDRLGLAETGSFWHAVEGSPLPW